MLKDITNDMNEKIFGDNETLEKRKSFSTVNGVGFKMPDNVFKKLIAIQTYFEVDNLNDIKENWATLSKQKMIPFELLAWCAKQLMQQHKDNPKLMEGITKNNTKILDDFKKVKGEKTGLLGKLTGGKLQMPTMPSTTLYLNQVKLEKIDSLNSEIMVGSEYDIIDVRGNKIKGVYMNLPESMEMFNNEHANRAETTTTINEMRLDPRPAMVICTPLNTKEPKLNIIKVQSGGKSIDPLIPTIRM